MDAAQNTVTIPLNPKDLKTTHRLEAFPNEYSGTRPYQIKCRSDEFSAVCPRSGLPDLYTLEITYIPGDYCVELKSLKMYLTCFRNVGMFVENLANLIADNFVEAIHPHFLQVVIQQAIRGGIFTTVNVTRGKHPEEPEVVGSDDYDTMS